MIANSFNFRNSYKHVPTEIAKSYYAAMRGDEIRRVRLANLLRLRERHTLERIAERTGTSAAYLSQIANGVVQVGGKRPRSLSDAYAAKIESGLGLPEGWMDHPHDGDQGQDAPSPPAAPDINALMHAASPRSRAALEHIAEAAEQGRLTDADLTLLEQIAERFARKE